VFNCIPDRFFYNVKKEEIESEQKYFRIGIIATDINSPYKGISFFLDAMRTFVKKYSGEVKICFISNGAEYKYFNEFESEWLRPINDGEFISALDSLDVVCVPSLIDNSPNVILESLARRVRVVASDSGGTGEIPELLNLRTFKYGDVEDFCSTLRLALENSLLDIDAHKKLINLVSEKVHAQKLHSIYESMI
jgi:glycosyltransferase involved in cell wall biosynthesis